jgi:hypothetical protein
MTMTMIRNWTRWCEMGAVLHTISLLQLFAASCPEALVVREASGLTPLLQVLQFRDAWPCQEIVEILLGKRACGYGALPPWANDFPLHALRASDFPLHTLHETSMVPTADTGQLPLQIAAKEMPANYSLIQTRPKKCPPTTR